MKALMRAALAAGAMLLCTWAAAGPPQEQKVKLDIVAQSMEQALNAFAEQTGFQLLFRASEVPSNLRAPRLAGTYTPADALKQLLANTPLDYEFINARTVAIRAVSAGGADAQRTSIGSGKGNLRFARIESGQSESMQKVVSVSTEDEMKTVGSPATSEITDVERSKGVPEILVKGRRSLNTDIQRTEDAPQPYVVFGAEEIQRSQAVNLDEFLRTRLPMNTTQISSSQLTGSSTNTSNINLRGLGLDQTLILVNGRRMPGNIVSTDSLFLPQPDLNGIPLSAIERIEVLPSTAGGIYGGSATGGVVNIILRRDFRGLEAKATYANTFDTDAAHMRLDASAGFSLEGGRTQVMIAATRSEANNLVIGDRDFAARAIELQRTNNPANIAALTTPPLGATVNIRSAEGTYNPVPAGTPGSLSGLPIGTFISGTTSAPTTVENPNLLLVTMPLTLKNGTALNSILTHLPLGYAGFDSDNGAALVANAGRYNLDPPGGMNGLERGLVSAPSMESASLNVRREFGARLEAFLDLSRLGSRGSSFTAPVPSAVSNLPANAPNNPFQQAIAIRFPTPGLSFENGFESTTVRVTGGLIARLPYDWMGEASYGWSRLRSQSIGTTSVWDSVGTCVLGRGVAANVILGAPGPTTPCAAEDPRPALNVLQEGNTFPIDFTPYLLPSPNRFSGPFDTTLRSATLRLSGPVVNLPGGPLILSSLIEHRAEGLEDAFVQTINPTTRAWSYSFTPHRSQNADSYYLEARAPLISRRNARSWVRELELQASVRRDDYKTRSTRATVPSVPSREGPFPPLVYTTARLDSTDYTLALRYAPLGDLALRASFGTGFLPPSVNQIVPSVITFAGSVGADSKRGNTPMYVGVPFTVIMGGNPDLGAEGSESRSAGVIFTPRFAPGFRLSIDYTRIEKVEEIQSPGFQVILDNEDDLPGRIVRGANLAGDPLGWVGPIISMDITFLNIAKTSVEAYDVQADYTWATERFGEFHGYAIATRQTHYRNQLLPGAAAVDNVGFNAGPLEWRGNFGLGWNKGPLALSWNAQYYDAYLAYTATASDLSRASTVLNQGSAWIPSQIYHDLIASYSFDADAPFARGLLANGEISFGIQNLFDESPPILASNSPISAGYSTYGDPRLRRYTLSIRKSFGM